MLDGCRERNPLLLYTRDVTKAAEAPIVTHAFRKFQAEAGRIPNTTQRTVSNTHLEAAGRSGSGPGLRNEDRPTPPRALKYLGGGVSESSSM